MVKRLLLWYGCRLVESQFESKSVKIGKRDMLRMLVALLPIKSRIHNGSKIDGGEDHDQSVGNQQANVLGV